jgi:DNA-directed RNA polymerase subunit M/transcription elongation factor TFIIS
MSKLNKSQPPKRCPRCNDEFEEIQVESYDREEELTLHMWCNDCGYSWNEYYTFTHLGEAE